MIRSRPYSKKGEKNYEKIYKKTKIEVTCECGAIMCLDESTGYRIVNYNEKGDIIYAECKHGYVVINEK